MRLNVFIGVLYLVYNNNFFLTPSFTTKSALILLNNHLLLILLLHHWKSKTQSIVEKISIVITITNEPINVIGSRKNIYSNYYN